MKKKPIKLKIDNPIVPPKHPGQFKKIHEKPTEAVMASYGALRFTLKETAMCLGMSYDTLNRFLKEDEALRASFDAGLLRSVSSITRSLYQAALKDPKIAIRVLESADAKRWNKTHIVENITDDKTKKEETERLAELLLKAARNPTND